MKKVSLIAAAVASTLMAGSAFAGPKSLKKAAYRLKL